jgi:hypothetical protein
MRKEFFITGLLLGVIFITSMKPPALALSFDDWDAAAPSEAENDESDWLNIGKEIGRVQMLPQFQNGNLVRIEVKVADLLSPVLGAAFHLNYDVDSLAFLRYEPGDFFERGGDPFYLVTGENGVIIFGETLRREDEFPLGEGSLVVFYFQVLKEGKTELRFEKGVLSTLDSVRQDLINVTWEDLILDRNMKYDGGPQVESGQTSVLDSVVNEDSEGSLPFLKLLGLGILSLVLVLVTIRKIRS